MNEQEKSSLEELIDQCNGNGSNSNSNTFQSIIDGQLLYLYLKYQEQDEYFISLARKRPLEILSSFNGRDLKATRDTVLRLYGVLFKGVNQQLEYELGTNQQQDKEKEESLNNLQRLYNDTIDSLVSSIKVPEEINFIDEEQIDQMLMMVLEYHYNGDDNEKNSYWTNDSISKLVDSILTKLISYQKCTSFKDICIQRKQSIYTTFLPIANRDDKTWQKRLITIHAFKSFIILLKENELVDIITYEFKLLVQSALANMIQNTHSMIKIIGIQILNYLLSISSPTIYRSIINDDIYNALNSSIELFDIDDQNTDDEFIRSSIGLTFDLLFKLLFSIYHLNTNEITHPLFMDQSQLSVQQQQQRSKPTTTTLVTPFSRHQDMIQLIQKILSSEKSSTFKKTITLRYSVQLFQALSIYLTMFLKNILPILIHLIEHWNV
ncbi:hypothetical protein DFA_03944 [Cavenderia fasciculata]|uniref:Uncharacterized protein n=1 Tax=Cavenderia fasciculata TaxID=261658 RepID=F4Q0U9_CACFS|nr:uncharacterized protein DFA_03944 [Cavenderia fasciculata]EGG18450.1 hypothetical protein DFA_03944 [Cavenderia fasciculata]|eukprot:XP_004366354.1 hypothetical protein DFA_03944 [Cavenderia fasciculata]